MAVRSLSTKTTQAFPYLRIFNRQDVFFRSPFEMVREPNGSSNGFDGSKDDHSSTTASQSRHANSTVGR
jgi:hypothetical protein